MKINLLKKLLIVISVFLLTGCFNNSIETEQYEIEDVLGRKVMVQTNIERVVCIGASALRLYCYVGDVSKLVGVEEFEKGNKMPVRPYRYAYGDVFSDLPSVGSGGPNSVGDAEAILTVNPDVVFSLYNDVSMNDNIQNQTGIPVVCLSYGGSDPFSQQVVTSLNLLGKVLSREERASEVISYINDLKNDLNTRTENIEEANKPSVYLGCNTYNGGHGSFGDTLVNYAPFREINAKNVVSDSYPTNNPTLDYETLLELNPDKIFIDIANTNKFKDEYSIHKSVLDNLDAIKNGEVYIQMPFNQYYTNLEIAICDTYYIGKVLYETQFEDINVEEKFDEICSKMLDKTIDYYELCLNDLEMGFGKLDFK